MQEIERLNRICKVKNIPFCFDYHDGYYYMNFGISKDVVRILYGLWHYFRESYPHVLVQYFSQEHCPAIQVIGQEPIVKDICYFFSYSKILSFDVKAFEVMELVLQKLNEEQADNKMPISFLIGNSVYPYLLRVPDSDLRFKLFFLRSLVGRRLRSDKHCYGFHDISEVEQYAYNIYSNSSFNNTFQSLTKRFSKK